MTSTRVPRQGGGQQPRRSRNHEQRDESGWIAATTLVWVAAVAGILLVALTAATDVLVARARAQGAADAAALAAASASPLVGGQGSASAAAQHLAVLGGATLTACECDALEAAEVLVSVAPRTAIVRLTLPQVAARARAELVRRER